MAALVLAACGGGGPPDQEPAARNELNGIATADGVTLRTANISVKGAAGPSRTNGFSGNPSKRYAVTTEQLTGPFMVGSLDDGLYSVATANGRANITPLTTLLVMALFGQNAADAFNDYGDASREQMALINSAEIQRAQQDATDFLETTLQVRVRSGTASFITADMQLAAGDPMWDTLVELNARIAELGPDAYGALLASFIQRQQQCRLMQVEVAIAGATKRFCPGAASSAADEADAGVVQHVFSQSSGETLTLRTRADVVVDLAYVTADGERFACSGSSCAGVALGQAAFDTTRSVTLTSVALAGDTAEAAASGRLSTAMPDVALADLPCLVGYLHKIGPDGSVVSECADNTTALQVFNVTGTVGGQQGASTHTDFVTNNISIVLDGNEVVSVTALVPSADGLTTVTAECRGSGCLGVTIGAPTVNRNLGIETTIRTVRLDGTVLQAVDAEGLLTPVPAARLKASLRLLSFSNVQLNFAEPNTPPQCDSGQTLLARLAPLDTPQWVYGVCSVDSIPVSSTPLDNGGIAISFNGAIFIDTDADGQVIRARISGTYAGGLIAESFGCDGLADCADVHVGAADEQGGRQVSISGALFRNVAFDGFASGPRTGRVDAAFTAVASGG